MADVMRGVISSVRYSPCRSSPPSAFLRHSAPRTVFLSSGYSFSSSQLQGASLGVSQSSRQWRLRRPRKSASLRVRAAQTCIPRAQRWWEKGVHANMKEVHSTQEFVDCLLNAGERLVVVDFYSPFCGACRSLHPKICQLAELNPDVEFVKVNFEDNKSMCYSLNIHVLPFFQFYRGAQGLLCRFSCTNATIKKFKDALAKHNTPRCSLGPPRGLGEPDLLALSSNKSLSFSLPRKPTPEGAGRKEDQSAFAVGSGRKEDQSAFAVGSGRNPQNLEPVGSDRKAEEPSLVGAGR